MLSHLHELLKKTHPVEDTCRASCGLLENALPTVMLSKLRVKYVVLNGEMREFFRQKDLARMRVTETFRWL